MENCDVETEIEFENDVDASSQNEIVEINSGEFRTDGGPRDVKTLCEWIRKGRLIVNPDFQRKYVWDIAKATRLIESVLLRVPLPVVYFAKESGDKFSVIDGQQRLTTLKAFIDGKFDDGREFKLSRMTSSAFSNLRNKSFAQLTEELQNRILETFIPTVTFLESDPNLKFDVFERLNTGAVALNDQELRNCIYRGNYNLLLRELAEYPEFKALLDIKGAEKRMRDVELVLRFAAFYHSTYLQYKSPIKRFLNNEMNKYKDISEEDAKELKEAFKKAVYLVRSLLGKNAFRRFFAGDHRGVNGRWETKKFNVSLFDILMYTMGRNVTDKNKVMRNKDAILESYMDLMTSDMEFIESIEKSTSSFSMVVRRFDKWRQRLDEILNADNTQPRCFSFELKSKLFNANPTCAICGQSISCIEDAAVDHIKQYWLGGETIPENARLVHRYCNCARPRND